MTTVKSNSLRFRYACRSGRPTICSLLSGGYRLASRSAVCDMPSWFIFTYIDFTCDLNTDEYGRPYYGPNDGPLNFIYAPPNLLLPPARPGNVTLLFTAKDDVQQYWRGVKSVCGPLLDSNECGVKPGTVYTPHYTCSLC